LTLYCESLRTMKRESQKKRAVRESLPAAVAEEVVDVDARKRRRVTRSSTRKNEQNGQEQVEEEQKLVATSVPTGSSSRTRRKSVAKPKAVNLIKARSDELPDHQDKADLDGLEGGTPPSIAENSRDLIEEKRLKAMMRYEETALAQEQARLQSIPNNELTKAEIQEHLQNSFYVVGVDEVGVGPLAGPIVSCAVAFQFPIADDKLELLAGVNDSKKLNAAKRKQLAEVIKSECFTLSLGIVTSIEVDELNPLQGSIEAMRRAVQSLSLSKSSTFHLLVDHHHIPHLDEQMCTSQTSITKGDAKSIAIASASIVAKVYRDDYMAKLHQTYPDFGFDQNAGYGTARHMEQLRKGVTCPEHRASFEPVRLAHRKALGLPPDAPPKKTKIKTKTAAMIDVDPPAEGDGSRRRTRHF
jgi:ribonuclease HII